MKLVGAANQRGQHFLYRADGTITTGGTAQLLLGCSPSRSRFIFTNNSPEPMWLECGAGQAHATLTSGAVTAVTVDNAGFNFTKPPLVRFFGGGQPAIEDGAPGQTGLNTSYVGLAQPGGPSPSHFAVAHAVLGGGAISSIVVDDGGAGYQVAPYVQIINSDLDPNGCALPAVGIGIQVAAGQTVDWNGSACPTEAIAVFAATTGDKFSCRWMD